MLVSQLSNIMNRDFKSLVPKQSRKVSSTSAGSYSIMWEKSNVFKGRNNLLSIFVSLETSPVLDIL